MPPLVIVGAATVALGAYRAYKGAQASKRANSAMENIMERNGVYVQQFEAARTAMASKDYGALVENMLGGGLQNLRNMANTLANFEPKRIDEEMKKNDLLMESGLGGLMAKERVAAIAMYDAKRQTIGAARGISKQQAMRMMQDAYKESVLAQQGTQGQLASEAMQRNAQLGIAGDQAKLQALSAAGQLYGQEGSLMLQGQSLLRNFDLGMLNAIEMERQMSINPEQAWRQQQLQNAGLESAQGFQLMGQGLQTIGAGLSGGGGAAGAAGGGGGAATSAAPDLSQLAMPNSTPGLPNTPWAGTTGPPTGVASYGVGSFGLYSPASTPDLWSNWQRRGYKTTGGGGNP